VANFAAVPANVNLTVTGSNGLLYSNVAPPARRIGDNKGARWSGTLSPAIPPQVTSIAPGVGPNGGYLPLSALGVGPIAGVGDDTLTNFNVPAFKYGDETYTRLGVVSNGYLVLGGGDSGDIVFVPQHFPNPARPNNVVAPFWSDLNPSSTGAGAIRIAILTDGVSNWIVVDWDGVRNFSNPTTHTFEVWLGIESEGITISYDTTGAGDPGSGVNYGAENRNGTSGLDISPAPVGPSEYIVTVSPPTAGGTASILYDASARRAGVYRSTASMTSNVTPGTTQVVQTLTVTP
jgi:hypothetical protein